MATLQLNPLPDAPDAGDNAATAVVEDAAEVAPDHPVLALVKRALAAEKPDMSNLTMFYLKLRNAEKDLAQQAKIKRAPLAQGMDLIEAKFLEVMLSLGVDSLKNEVGTPYKTEAVSITVADNSAFVDFVLDRALESLPVSPEVHATIKRAIIESGQLALIEARASKSAVEALLEETHELPPGLNRRVEVKVNVRTA